MPGFVIDRREHHKNKSSTSRDRFIKRYRDVIKKAAADSVKKAKGFRDITTGKEGQEHEITIDRKTLDSPNFSHGDGGEHEFVLSGNDEMIVGDLIPRPQGGAGGGGKDGCPDGEGEDVFTFYLDREEFLNLILDDLALPDMVKKNLAYSLIAEYVHAGFTKQGSPGNMDVMRSFKQSMSRRIGLNRNARKSRLCELENQLKILLADGGADLLDEPDLVGPEAALVAQIQMIRDEIIMLKAKMRAMPYFDPNNDLRYRHRELERKPSVSAVMFCVDGETEYLSPAGWRKISEYYGGRVAQYLEDGSMEFVEPNTYIKNDYDGEFIRLVAQGVDQALHPKHRVIYKSSDGKTKEILAEDLESHHNELACGFRGKFISHFRYSGDGISLTDDEIRFAIAFKADGCYQQENTNRAQFIFKKERKISRLLAIIRRLGWNYTITDRTLFDNKVAIYVTTPTRIAKGYTEDWYQASAHQLQIISDEVLYWDGYFKRGTFTAKQKKDADYVQFVWASCGYGTNLFEDQKSLWVVCRSSFAERSLTSKQPKKIVRETSEDKHSYCFNVPSGMLILRRNNDIFVTGNCVMDVSGSMTENMKMHAKYFFMLLHLFLKKNYSNVDVVFVRHTSYAEEVTEDVFFYDRETGGTIVSSALEKVVDIIKERYDPLIWNIYIAQASDGDNYGADSGKCQFILEDQLLQLAQYMVYVEMSDGMMSYHQQHGHSSTSSSDLWKQYEIVAKKYENLKMKAVGDKSEIYPVFRELFEKKHEPV